MGNESPLNSKKEERVKEIAAVNKTSPVMKIHVQCALLNRSLCCKTLQCDIYNLPFLSVSLILLEKEVSGRGPAEFKGNRIRPKLFCFLTSDQLAALESESLSMESKHLKNIKPFSLGFD